MKTPKIREAVEWLRSNGGPFSEGLGDAALSEVRALEAELSVAKSSLRDTFAAAALTGLMANPSTSGLLPDASKAHSLAARIAYASADAMLAAREGK